LAEIGAREGPSDQWSGLAAKMANSIDRSIALHKTYASVDIDAVRNVDQARLEGHHKMRGANKSSAKYQPVSQVEYQLNLTAG